MWRSCGAALTLAAVVLSPSRAEPVGAVRIEADDLRGLERQIIEISDRWLGASGLSIDAARAHLVLAGTFAKGRFDVTPLWPAGAAPVLPLSFELRAVDAHADPRASALRATLAAPLMRETAVAVRRVRRGAPLTCDDVVVARIPSRRQARQPLSLPCHVKEGAIALRELGAGDVVDESDIGDANGVLAGEPVDVRLRVGSITVTTTGTALSDARAGEPADVRLRHPTRTLRSRVVARSVVELQEPLQ